MATTRRTNTEALEELMEFSRCGPLMQAFVLTAIEKYAAQCIKAGPEKFDSGFMAGSAWIACATEAQAAVKAHLEG